jgi:hypothetical protein
MWRRERRENLEFLHKYLVDMAEEYGLTAIYNLTLFAFTCPEGSVEGLRLLDEEAQKTGQKLMLPLPIIVNIQSLAPTLFPSAPQLEEPRRFWFARASAGES